jgi:Ca-activated chloride channel homolog
MFFFRFAYPWVFVAVPLYLFSVIFRIRFRKSNRYHFPLTSIIKSRQGVFSGSKSKIIFSLRAATLALLVLLSARPQWVDQHSKVNVEGVDIVLAMDISGSMQIFDDVSDRRTRISVAKTEAIKFIDKRVNDPIGIVIFGAETLSLVPPTLDKSLLKESVEKLEIGYINPNGTALEQGLASAVSRLRNSKAKSKIIVLLTDGQPTPGLSAISMDQATDLAKQYKIKVYTMGVGSPDGGYIEQFGRVMNVGAQDAGIDKELLRNIAEKTGGKFFHAKNPKEIAQIYNTIDQLEKTEQESDLFSNYYEAFWPFAIPLLFLIFADVILRTWFWRGLAW